MMEKEYLSGAPNRPALTIEAAIHGQTNFEYSLSSDVAIGYDADGNEIELDLETERELS